MKIFVATILLVIIYSYSGQVANAKGIANNHKSVVSSSPKTRRDTFESVTSRVEALPEYDHILKWYSKTNKDKNKYIMSMVKKGPDADFKYYAVSVGEYSDTGFVSIVDFYVDPKDLSIYYYNPVTDSVLTLDQWRKSRSKKWPN